MDFSFNGGFIIGNWSTVFLLLISNMGDRDFYAYWGVFVIIGELLIPASAVLSGETRNIELT